MSRRGADREDVPSRVHRSVRRTVGLKVMRDLSYWAGDVERQRAQLTQRFEGDDLGKERPLGGRCSRLPRRAPRARRGVC